MKKIIKLEGLGCASCAAKIEKEVAALDGVTKASVNFLTAKLIIEGDISKMESIIGAVSKIVKKTEPDVKITVI